MNKILKGYIIGTVSTSMLICGVTYAKNSTEYIEAHYQNIKVYVDNVLTELKDSNGTTIEPFIYNGTTYMPVRGTAEAAGMQVTWDGNTKSVYLWDKIIPNDTYLMEVCPPYEKSYCNEYLQTKGQHLKMGGKKYSNGFSLWTTNGYALINLNSKYSTVNMVVGHRDDTYMADKIVMFFVDGKVVKVIDVNCEDMPKSISIPVNYGLQLKVLCSEGGSSEVGFGNIVLK